MRIERWYWLPIFCVVSAAIHFGLTYGTRNTGRANRLPDLPSIEVTFDPAVVKPIPKPEPKIVPQLQPKPTPSVTVAPRRAALSRARIASLRNIVTPERTERIGPRTLVGKVPVPVALKPKAVPFVLPEHISSEAPQTTRHAQASLTAPPTVHRTKADNRMVEGGGSPSPAPIAGGTGGLKAPETPREDVLYTGGGKGGANLPNVAPTIGGGGGVSILHVKGDNPLGDGIPDDKPGLGPGIGGGIGTGSKGGIGFASGKGIGTQPDGKVALGSLRRGKGPGIGAAASGSETGTKPPGGGRGRGADLPGTGGTGNGYGRGHGTGIGEGDDDSGPPLRARGVPFGNVAGLLGGDNGSPNSGGPGRGAVFGSRLASGGEGPIHIVYALDISGSMREKHKIEKAEEALKAALGTLRRYDTFNIIVFKRDAATFREDSVSATPANVANAKIFVDQIQIGEGTNISGAMDLAFGMNGVSHVYLMSDGEPNDGIRDFAELRRFVREKNVHNIKVTTLALGLGETFPGVLLLKGIAEDNHGTFDYIDMNKIPRRQNNP